MKRLVLVFISLFANVNCAIGQEFEFNRKDTLKEIEIGRMYYDQAIRLGLLSKNEANVRRVNRIFNSLLQFVEPKVYPYQVVVLAAQDEGNRLESVINAGCWPGGYIVVHDALVALLVDDDALAMVLAHEIGHAYKRHSVRQAKDAELAAILAGLSIGLGGDPNAAMLNVQLRGLRYSRDMEREADAFGIQLFLKAGYDQKDAPLFFDWILEEPSKSRSRPPGYLDTHPDPASRAKFIRNYTANYISPAVKTTENPLPTLTEIVGVMPTVSPASNPYFPLEIGFRWTYEVKSASTSSAYSVSVKSAIAFEIGFVFRMETRLSKDSQVSWQCFTTASDIWRRNMPERQESTWKREFSLSEPESVTNGSLLIKRLLPETVVIPIGTFTDVIGLEITDTVKGTSTQVWFAKDIGLIKRVSIPSGITEILVGFKKPS